MKLLRTLLMAGALLGSSVPAFATVRVGVNLGVDPWRPEVVAPARAGYVWVPGHYDAVGLWVPGFYRPVESRAGFAFEPGYWREGTYYDGYWRPERNGTNVWIPGHYSVHHKWIEGHWGRR